jgi:protein arginine kinase activator
MLCQKCHKNLATVRYAEVIDGQVKELHMCSACINEHHAEEASGFALSGDAPAPRRNVRRRKQSETLTANVECQSCGSESKQIAQESIVGCAVCYDTFGDELENLVRERHAALIHRGKAPNRDDQREKVRVELQTKRALLRSALRSERYEEAASLRDVIKALEQKAGLVVAGPIAGSGNDD